MDLLFGLIPLASDPNAEGAPFTHDRTLVGVSMLAAVVTAYAFLEMAARARAHTGVTAALWRTAAGAMMGGGIWATHFIGLVAFETPLEHGFFFMPTAISCVVGIVCGALAFLIAGERPSWPALLMTGVGVGVGMVVMHYLGMLGLRIEAELSYRPIPVAATSAGALLGIVTAFLLGHRLDSSWLRGVLAFPMGAVTAGLHYTDIAATIITPKPAFTPPQQDSDALLALLAIAATGIIVGLALAAVVYDRRRADAPPEKRDTSDVVVIPHPSRRASDEEGTVVHIPDRNARSR